MRARSGKDDKDDAGRSLESGKGYLQRNVKVVNIEVFLDEGPFEFRVAVFNVSGSI